jgi:hypothetical protein
MLGYDVEISFSPLASVISTSYTQPTLIRLDGKGTHHRLNDYLDQFDVRRFDVRRTSYLNGLQTHSIPKDAPEGCYAQLSFSIV